MVTKRILAIDPGAMCGWAVQVDGAYQVGAWDLTKPGNHEHRWLNFWHNLDRAYEAHDVSHIVYEQVEAHPSSSKEPKDLFGYTKKKSGTNIRAAHAYGGYVAIIQLWCTWRAISFSTIQVKTIKKYATGNGNANKGMMLKAAQQQWPELQIHTHDQADAIWILDAYMAERNSSYARYKL